MSTFLLAASPGQTLENISTLSGVAGGALQTANSVELQVSQATTVVTDNGSTRQIQKNEVLLILELYMQYITRMNWPFATS